MKKINSLQDFKTDDRKCVGLDDYSVLVSEVEEFIRDRISNLDPTLIVTLYSQHDAKVRIHELLLLIEPCSVCGDEPADKDGVCQGCIDANDPELWMK